MKQAGSRCVGRYPGWRHACIAFPAACSRQPVASVMQVGHRDGPVGYTLSRRTPPSSIQPRPLDRCGGSAGTSTASCLPRLSCFPLNCHPLNMNGEHQRGDCSGPASGHAFVTGYRYRPLHKCDCNATPRWAGSRVSRARRRLAQADATGQACDHSASCTTIWLRPALLARYSALSLIHI